MLLRNPISTTKRFLNKTLGNLKNLFSSSSYQKLPKSPAIYNAYSTTTPISASSITTTTNVHDMNINIHNTNSYKNLDKFYNDFTDQWDSKRHINNNKRLVLSSPTMQNQNVVTRRESRDDEGKRGLVVKEKLKESEMLDVSNVDHVQEVYHYYARLTWPAYLEIVDSFFMEMCDEFFGEAASSTTNVITDFSIATLSSFLAFVLEFRDEIPFEGV